MKRAIIVRCKRCTKEWYVRESREGEFESPITLTCPHCHALYKRVDYKELYVSKCSKFSILRVMHLSKIDKPRIRTSFTFIIIILVIILLLSIISYIILHP